MKDVIINVWIRSLFSRHFHRQTKRKKWQWGQYQMMKRMIRIEC
ncbi:hypothetical protein [Priestia filamentosa]|nr:hypothetical protein [Priestia filamentosa]MDT3762223.1 hypothetical protein [Priestia filamentosa]WRU96713.1 hypothetical protein RYX51_06430 [Priestia filamentosa]